MIQRLALADKDFNITMTSMLNKIKEKTDNIGEILTFHHRIKNL